MAYDIGPLDNGGDRGARRLLALSDHLESIDQSTYDHRVWRRRRGDGGWAMCAFGHAVSALPDLIGLRWRDDESLEVVRQDGSGVTEDPLILAAEAFDLTLEEAQMIFGVGLYTVAFYGPAAVFKAKPKTVAAAIRAYALRRMARAAYPLEAAAVA